MARIQSTHAIVLRSRPYSADYGRLQLQAKGARRPRSKFGAALEVLTMARVIFYRSEAKHIFTLSDAEIVEDWPALRSEAARLRAAMVMAEFTEHSFEPDAPSPRSFHLFSEGLQAIETGGDALAVAFSYMYKAASVIGYAPQIDCCVACHKRKAATFSARRGGLLCGSCSAMEPEAVRIDLPTIRGLRRFRDASLARNAAAGAAEQVRELTWKFLQYHIERLELKSLRSLKSRDGIQTQGHRGGIPTTKAQIPTNYQ